MRSHKSRPTIRKLGLGDADEFIRIRLEGLLVNPTSFGRNYEEEQKRPRSDFEEFLAPSRRRIVWGAFRGASLVGLIRLECEGRDVRRYIYSMYVTPNERRHGLARCLLRIAFNRAVKSRQVREIQLFVDTENASAIELYRSFGFAICGIEKGTRVIAGQARSEYTMRRFVRARRTSSAAK